MGDLVVPELTAVGLEDIFGKGVGGIVGVLVIMIGGLGLLWQLK